MTVYYTGKGDKGSTGTLGACRMEKDSKLAAAIGDVDELNSAVGVALSNVSDERIAEALRTIQNRLFTVGAELASDQGTAKKIGVKTEKRAVKELEEEIDELGSRLPELKKFVLPGGCPSSSYLHLARSIARRAERSVVAASKNSKLNPNLLSYMNRLSSFFFVAALYLNEKEGIEELHPSY